MQGLNAILGNRSQLMVLRTLYHARQPMTGRDVERAVQMSNRATMLALESLCEAGVVHLEPAGRAYHYSLNRTHYLIAKGLKAAFDSEVLFWDDVSRTIRRVVRPRPMAAVATGPLAREEADYGGRMTLTMLFETGRERQRALMAMDRLADAVLNRYSMTAEYHLLDLNTMDREEYEPLWRRVAREGILLYGTLP